MTITIETYAQNIRNRIEAGFKAPSDISHMARAIRVTLPNGTRLPHTMRSDLNNQIRMACKSSYARVAKAVAQTKDQEIIAKLSPHAVIFGCHAFYGNRERIEWIKKFYGAKLAQKQTGTKRNPPPSMRVQHVSRHANP